MTDQDRLHALWEREEVKKTMLRFGRSLDLGDWAAYRSCFTDPLTVDFQRLTGQPKVVVDPDHFTRFAECILSPVRRHHVFSNWDIDVHEDRAAAIVYMTARHWKATDIGASSNAQYGWYDVRFVKQRDSWLITEIKHDFQWIEGNGGLFDMTDPQLIEAMGQVFSEANIKAAAAPL